MAFSSTEFVANLLTYLKEQELYEHLPEIVHTLEKELTKEYVIAVISAEALSAEEKQTLTKKLQEKWGEQRVEFSVDASLRSGMLIRFKDQIIDFTGQSRLQQLAELWQQL